MHGFFRLEMLGRSVSSEMMLFEAPCVVRVIAREVCPLEIHCRPHKVRIVTFVVGHDYPCLADQYACVDICSVHHGWELLSVIHDVHAAISNIVAMGISLQH